MRTLINCVGTLICGVLLLSGCGDSGYELSKQDLAAFKDAKPELKKAWEDGLKADRVNDYGTASASYRSLLSQDITPEQLMAVQTALGSLNYRINEAAAKGDAAAQKTLEAGKQSAPRR